MVEKHRLTREGLLMAWVATCEEAGKKFTVWEGFKLATRGKGFLQYALAGICVIVCVPIGVCWRLIKGHNGQARN